MTVELVFQLTNYETPVNASRLGAWQNTIPLPLFLRGNLNVQIYSYAFGIQYQVSSIQNRVPRIQFIIASFIFVGYIALFIFYRPYLKNI